jgi:1-deoxy-D-xylulose-5-phosphate synthase
MRWAKPLDTELLIQVAQTHTALVTLEDGSIMGGAGSAVLEALQAAGLVMPVLQLGLPDAFIEHGDPSALMASLGLNAQGIQASIRSRFAVN